MPVICQVFLIWRKQYSAQRSAWCVSVSPGQPDQCSSVSLALKSILLLSESIPGDGEDVGQDSMPSCLCLQQYWSDLGICFLLNLNLNFPRMASREFTIKSKTLFLGLKQTQQCQNPLYLVSIMSHLSLSPQTLLPPGRFSSHQNATSPLYKLVLLRMLSRNFSLSLPCENSLFRAPFVRHFLQEAFLEFPDKVRLHTTCYESSLCFFLGTHCSYNCSLNYLSSVQLSHWTEGSLSMRIRTILFPTEFLAQDLGKRRCSLVIFFFF